MRIAIVGAGVSGLVSAYLLNRSHEVTVFEANDYIGGHTNTVEVRDGDRVLGIDTGFIVFNELNYPNFCRLLGELEIPWQDSNMSFSVRSDRHGIEYRGSSLNTLFAQRRNLLRPSFHRMVRDIFRFFREAPAVLESQDEEMTLGEYLEGNRYSREFIEWHLVPMASALWSTPADRIRGFPVLQVIRFLDHHRMLAVSGRPVWKTVLGGSRRYVDAITRGFRSRIRLQAPVRSVRRAPDRIEIATAGRATERFDEVVVATHADQALQMLEDPNEVEQEFLGMFPYQRNEAVLHTDRSIMPRNRKAWASWNYYIPADEREDVSVTYHQNRLQAIDSQTDYCVSLNPGPAVDHEQVLAKFIYHHPTFVRGALSMQKRHRELIRRNRTSFVGAYWGFGFHEDGVKSALAVAEAYGEML